MTNIQKNQIFQRKIGIFMEKIVIKKSLIRTIRLNKKSHPESASYPRWRAETEWLFEYKIDFLFFEIAVDV